MLMDVLIYISLGVGIGVLLTMALALWIASLVEKRLDKEDGYDLGHISGSSLRDADHTPGRHRRLR